MSLQSKTVKTDDASGRGAVGGFKVPFPAKMRPYSEDEIQVVVDFMRSGQCQTQGECLRQFEADLKG